MRYLVTAEEVEGGALSPQQQAQMMEQMIIPSLEACVKLEAEKKIVAGGPDAGGRGGTFIMEAASHEELSQLLTSLPFWRLFKWNVTPQESLQHRLGQARKMLERIKAAAK